MSKKLYNFIEKAKQVHGDKYDYSLVNYINNDIKVKLKCNRCLNIFEILPHNHISKSNKCGCPKCAINGLKSNFINFTKKAKQIHGDKYDYSLVNYINAKTKVKIICKKHGIFEQKPNNHLSGQGCSKCKIISKGELAIERYLKEHDIKYISQYKFKDCRNKRSLPFDFYLPDYNTCIEYDGKQHYNINSKYYNKDLIENDIIKTNYCKNNNIKLIRINYNKFKNINNIVNKIINTYRYEIM